MAETPLVKRQREETLEPDNSEDSKRHKTYTQILSILEEEEDESNQDLSAIFTTLQQELSSNSTSFEPLTCPSSETEQNTASKNSECSPNLQVKEDDEEERERVIRHLLEASDDELGIPNKVEDGYDEINGGDHSLIGYDGLWEFEDEAANYYELLQSELFM